VVRKTKQTAKFRARAVRAVHDARADYPTKGEAIAALSKHLGMAATTLSKWVRTAEAESRRHSESSAIKAKKKQPDQQP
jgi:transposase-like protein